jgi:LysM repeat protein
MQAKASESDIQSSARGTTLGSISHLQSASTGLISGELSFPGERIPALTIFAIRIDNGKNTFYSIETGEDQSNYSIRVDPGVYQLLAYAGEFASGYTQSVKCGMDAQCQDHSLSSVVVEAGAVLTAVDILDWYAPRGTFPARPDRNYDTASEPTVACSGYHTVKSGENLYRIGLIYNMTWTPIATANNIQNPDFIYAGQVLCIPIPVQSNTWKPSSKSVPTFEIVSVVKNKQVTIKTNDFPPDTDFEVTMGKIGTQGIDGLDVTTINSGQGGSFTATYSIPSKLKGQYQISIRMQSSTGYYSYNWFYNNTSN